MGTNIIKEVSVMGYDEDCSEIVCEEVLKPAYSVDIKVVCRLVKKDNVGVTEKCLCQKDFNLFVTAKVSHLRIHNTFVKSKTLH